MDERITKAFNLHFRADRKWRALPSWARFFISLGASMGCTRHPDRRIVAVISVPTSSFASAFISLGRVLAEPIAEPATEAIDRHFEKLSLLAEQTPLMFFDKDADALHHGPFLGIQTINAQPFIGINTRSGKRFVPKARSLMIDLEPDRQQPKAEPGKAGRLRGPKAFVNHFYSQIEHYRLCCSTTKCVTVVGAVNRLRSELVQTQFAMKTEGGHCQGVLQDLIRVGKFAAGGLGCRAGVYAASRGRPHRDVPAEGSLLIFDGATPLLRWAHQDSRSDNLVILDRTDPSFGDGVSAANNRYFSRADDCKLTNLLTPPPGIDLMVHTEAIR